MGMSFSQFSTQFTILAWKNAVLSWRGKLMLLSEIMIPVAIIITLGSVKNSFGQTKRPQLLPSDYIESTSLEDLFLTAAPRCREQNLVWDCLGTKSQCRPYNTSSVLAGLHLAICQRKKIAVAPSFAGNLAASAAASDFIEFAKYISASATTASTFTLFGSEEMFLDAISGSEYIFGDIYSSAIIFYSGSPNWEYTIRLNRTFTYKSFKNSSPDTLKNPIDISVKNGKTGLLGSRVPYLEVYLRLGLYTISDTVNSFIATQTKGSLVTIRTAGIVDFPSAESVTSGFWNSIGLIFALLIIIALLLPLTNMISALVEEKETKTQEGMMMMGLRSDALWLSWMFHFLMIFLPLSTLLTLSCGNLFYYSERVYIFMYFTTFLLSVISYSILISTFFSHARTAAITGCLVFLTGFFIFLGLSSANPSRLTIIAASLHPATAFTFGTLAFTEYEGANIGVTSYTWDVSNVFNVTLRDCINMMVVDAVWMIILAWYVANVWPSEYGTHQPFYFFLLPSYWYKFTNEVNTLTEQPLVSEDILVVEDVTDNLRQQVMEKSCIEIRGLVKEFKTETGITKKAVDGLNLTMFSGQILALLGHNGAGKTTTINILTGITTSTEGSAVVFGQSVHSDMIEIRKNLGVCPQHDILFPKLTVEEHLLLFASFKGMTGVKLKQEVNKMIEAIGLVDKRTSLSSHLSGGQKRKLSVGMAFIGDSKVVILDEPTSGMGKSIFFIFLNFNLIYVCFVVFIV